MPEVQNLLKERLLCLWVPIWHNDDQSWGQGQERETRSLSCSVLISLNLPCTSELKHTFGILIYVSFPQNWIVETSQITSLSEWLPFDINLWFSYSNGVPNIAKLLWMNMPSSVYGQLSLVSLEAPVTPWPFPINREANIKVKYWQQFPLGSKMYMFYWIQKWPFSSKQWPNCRTLKKSILSTPNVSCISERYTIPCQVHYYPFKWWMACISYCSVRNEGCWMSGPLGRGFTGWIAFIFPLCIVLELPELSFWWVTFQPCSVFLMQPYCWRLLWNWSPQ